MKVGKTQFNEGFISKSSKKTLELIYKGRQDMLDKVLVIWEKHNPKPKGEK